MKYISIILVVLGILLIEGVLIYDFFTTKSNQYGIVMIGISLLLDGFLMSVYNYCKDE